MSQRAKRAVLIICLLAFAVRAAYLLEAQANPMHLAPQMDADQDIVINLSGRGDKDILTVAEIDGIHF